MPTNVFPKTTATVAAWNLATFDPLSNERIKQQSKGLRMLDAEFITLVEVKDEHHIRSLAEKPTNYGVPYEYTLVQQSPPRGGHGAMHIGALYKTGVSVS